MIFLKSQDYVFKWRVGDIWPPDVNSSTYLSPFLPPPPFLPLPSVARWQKFRPKSSKGAAEIKICGRILADFTKNRQKKGPQKIFKRSSLFLAVITVINLIFNIQYTNFLRPLFCLFLVKSAKIRPEIFFSVAPFELFGRNFCLATLQHWLCVVDWWCLHTHNPGGGGGHRK